MGSIQSAIDARLIKRLPAGKDGPAFELDIHIQLPAGVTALFGPSGAGKSLTLNCLAGFTQPDDGRILVNDEIYFDAAAHVSLPPQDRRCSYVFQDHALFPHMTVRENLRFAAASVPSSGKRRLQRHKQINELLETFELINLASRKPAQLSGGQRQRAALARILVNEPRLLLLDEPTRGLDERLRSGFYQVLEKTRERLQIPIILVTHDLDDCFQAADTICILEHGRLLQSGSKDVVMRKPGNAEAARVLGLHNVIPASIEALDPTRNFSRLRVLSGEIEGPYFPGHLIGDSGFVCVRKTGLRVHAAGDGRAQNTITLRVLETNSSIAGVRIGFEQNVTAVVSDEEFGAVRDTMRDGYELKLEIPVSTISFIGR